MLKKFYVNNFKSLMDFSFEPGPINLVIGLNNAGKTNLCHAIQFLTLSSQFTITDALLFSAKTLGFPNIYSAEPTIDFKCNCELIDQNEKYDFEYFLSINKEQKVIAETGPIFEVKNEYLKISGRRFKEVILLENRFGLAKILNEREFTTRNSENYVETHIAPNNTLLNKLFEFETSKLANLFKKYLRSWSYFDIASSQLRNADQKPNQYILAGDGSNLASVLYTLKTSNELRYRKLLDMLKRFDPRLYVINFILPPGSEKIYIYFGDEKGNTFDVNSVSNGTLRYLALCYIIIINENITNTWKMPPPVILIEEPEDGIFVGYFKDLFKRIESTGKNGQFIFTSHSPYFIDLFDKYIENVFYIRNKETHSELMKPDKDKILQMLDKFSLGEIHFRELMV